MLLTKEVIVHPSGKSIQYYKDRGYNVKCREPLTVKVVDLPKRSKQLVDVLCDYCKETIMTIPYYSYINGLKTIQKTSCVKCTQQKIKECNLINYGVENVSQLDSVKEKVKRTNFEKYGVENVLLNKSIKEKVIQTNLERYGVENVFSNKEIRKKRDATLMERYGTLYPLQNEECFEKLKQTNLDKYGVENVFKSEEIKQKMRQTSLDKYGFYYPSQNNEVKEKIQKTTLENYGVKCLLSLPEFHKHSRIVDKERYGVYHHLQSPKILEKQKNTFYKNGTCMASKQQRYLHGLYGGELNYPLMMYNLDIYLSDERINIEYDGSGHRLSCKFGSITEEEFNRKEITRNTVIKNAEIKQMRIISSTDKLPSDEVLLQMLGHTKKYFSDCPEHSWIEFNIDTSTVRNAEQKDGVFFNYGELRKIEKCA